MGESKVRRGRPPKRDPNAPKCPRGHSGRVVLSHLYGAAPHLRRMYRCVPEGRQPEGLEAKSHRFAPQMPRVIGDWRVHGV